MYESVVLSGDGGITPDQVGVGLPETGGPGAFRFAHTRAQPSVRRPGTYVIRSVLISFSFFRVYKTRVRAIRPNVAKPCAPGP